MKQKPHFLLLGALGAALAAALAAPALGQLVFEDISPDFTDTWALDPDRASGGRTNGLAISSDGNTMYGATEWGGLYKSSDAGLTWSRLTGHLPVATWDVAVDPSNDNRVVATSFFDGKATPVSGINVSTDAGVSWTRAASATPPEGFCTVSVDREEPSAFGISFDPSTPSTIYVGTNCGVAKSTNSGVSWTYIDPTSGDSGADRVTDVLALGGGVVHACGDDGHLRSDNGGGTWVQGTGIFAGRCSLAVSPDEDYVLLAAVGTSIFETTDGDAAGGASWSQTRSNLSPQGRIPFVATNQRADDGGDNVFDLWFGDVSLWRVSCTTPAIPSSGGSPRCGTGNSPAWAGPFTREVGGHDDMGDILFDPTVAVDACPVMMSSDGGVYRNTDTTADCHNPNWAEPDVTPHAIWPWSMNGNQQDGSAEDLYFGLQDNGLFASININDADPDWHNEVCCDGFDATGDDSGGLFSICCFGGGGRSTRVFRTQQGFISADEIPTYPSGGLQPSFDYPDSFATWGDGRYVMATRNCGVGFGGCTGADGGVFITTDIDAGAITWTELGDATEPPSAQLCGVYPSVNGLGTPTFYAQAGSCNSDGLIDKLYRYTGTSPGGTWTEVTLPAGSFGIVAVHPTDSSRLIASGLTSDDAQMFSSTNSGASWSAMPALDALMDGGGDFPVRNSAGPSGFSSLSGYWQPSMVAFDPGSDRIVAGGQDSGIFLSEDDGATWTLITDPRTSDVSGVPHIPRPRYGYFDSTETPARLFIGSQGGGIWRITLDGAIFTDGFESGNTASWSASFP